MGLPLSSTSVSAASWPTISVCHWAICQVGALWRIMPLTNDGRLQAEKTASRCVARSEALLVAVFKITVSRHQDHDQSVTV